MSSLAVRWNRFWLREASATSLAMFRIAFFSTTFLIYLGWDDLGWTQVSSAFWMPVSIFHILTGPPQDPALLRFIQMIWKASLVASALAILTRISTITAAILGVYILGLPNNFGKIDHQDGIVVILLCLLSVSRCGDALSVDRSFRGNRVPARDSYEYHWPIRLGQVLFTLIFFAAGFAKLRHSGLAWMTADNLRHLLLSHYYTRDPPTRLGLIVAQSAWLCVICAVCTVVIELSMPSVLFVQRLRYPLLLGLLLLQTAIALSMGVFFTQYLPAYLLFVPWDIDPRRLFPFLVHQKSTASR